MLPTLETDRPRQSRLAPFIAYVIAFHLAWAAWPYFIYRKLVAVGERTLTYALLNLSIRLLVWVAPVMLYLRFVDGVAPLADLELDRRVGRGLVVALALTAVNFVGSVVRFGLPHPTLQAVTWNSRAHLIAVPRRSPSGLERAPHADGRPAGLRVRVRCRDGDRGQVFGVAVGGDRHAQHERLHVVRPLPQVNPASPVAGAPFPNKIEARRDGRAVDGGGLENRVD
jgi:hypothetical protein